MMRKSVLKALLLLGPVSFLAGCSDDSASSMGQGTGRIVPNVELNRVAVTSVSKASVSDVAVSDLQLTLTKTDGSYTHTWPSVSDFPVTQNFAVGQYNLEATYGDAETEGFDCAAFYGKTELTVRDSETTTVSLTAALANCMVDITYTDELKAYMQAYSARVHSSKGNYIDVAADETRAVYLYPGHATVDVDVTRPDGKNATFEVASFNTEARNFYHVTVGLTNGASDAALTISIEGIEGQEEIEIELSDEIMNAPAPTVTTNGFNSGDQFVHIVGTDFAGDLGINIIAKGGLSAVTLQTVSKSLTNQGWPAEINLIGATSSQQATMKGLGLNAIGVFGVVDKMAVVNLKDVIKHIQLLSTDNTTTFTLSVKDKYNKVSDPVTVSFEVQALTVSLAKTTEMTAGDTQFSVMLTYNGADVENDVKFQYKNERGSWSPITPVSIEPTATRFVYKVTFNAPNTDNDNVIRATCGSTTSTEVTFTPTNPEITVSASANNCFATYAKLNVASSDIDVNGSNASLVKAFISTDGTNFTKATSTCENGVLTVTGLNPSTNYTVKVGTLDRIAYATGQTTFATEAAPTLPNSDMETWYRAALSSKYQWVDYPGADANAAWGTMNLLTTSTNGSSGRGGASYCAFSGTQPSNDSHSGSHSAYIATVGWGSGNTAAGGIGKCENVTAGQLYLGHYDSSSSSPVYGYAFTGRPKSMSFYYKYTAKNSSDYGLARIDIVDASGNVLASATRQLGSAGSFTQVTLPLNYAAGASKATQIRVIFKSSDNSECLSANQTNLSYPSFGNLSDGRYTGSELYIDDITLNY